MARFLVAITVPIIVVDVPVAVNLNQASRLLLAAVTHVVPTGTLEAGSTVNDDWIS